MNDINLLMSTAVFIGVVHTLIGVDHYVPFVVLSQANAWSMKKTMMIVLICGIGHVLSSVLLGFVGIVLSQNLASLVHIETVRGMLATYFLIGFGLIYTLWALSRLYKNKPHTHLVNGKQILHDHHGIESTELHHDAQPKSNLNTIWGLFILFVLGPCEPLIPLLMYPAASNSGFAFFSVTVAFSVCTISTMMVLTYVSLKGLKQVKLAGLEKYSHALAGVAITLCGVMILAFGF